MKFKSVLLCVAVLAIVAGCAVTRGGSGTTSKGEPVIGEIWQNDKLDQGFTISSVRGWSCTGQLSDKQRKETVKSTAKVPMTCDNGWTGTGLISVDRLSGKANINFRLSNGTIGNVKIG